MTQEIQEILDERRKTHGEFDDVAAVAQQIKEALRFIDTAWQTKRATTQEVLDAIACKMARIVCGNDEFIDHFTDVIGYSTIAMQSIENNPSH